MQPKPQVMCLYHADILVYQQMQLILQYFLLTAET